MTKSKLTKKDWCWLTLKIFLISLTIFLIYFFTIATIFKQNGKLKYNSNYTELQKNTVLDTLVKEYNQLGRQDLSLNDGKQLIQKLTNVYFYKEILIDLPYNNAGCANPIVRLVFIDKEIYTKSFRSYGDLNDYFIVLTHEYIHISKVLGDERATQFKTFKLLYESNNNRLKQCAIQLAINILYNRYPQEYDCSYYIIEYIQSLPDYSKESL